MHAWVNINLAIIVAAYYAWRLLGYRKVPVGFPVGKVVGKWVLERISKSAATLLSREPAMQAGRRQGRAAGRSCAEGSPAFDKFTVGRHCMLNRISSCNDCLWLRINVLGIELY